MVEAARVPAIALGARFLVSLGRSADRMQSWTIASWVTAVLSVALATVVRWQADGVLPPGFPFLTYFPAVILTTYFCGTRPGILSAALSTLAAWHWFIAPANGFALNVPTAVALLFFVFVISVDILLIHLMSSATRRLAAEQARATSLHDAQVVMFHEMQHRVANNMQFVSALLALQKREVARSPEKAPEAFDEATKRLTTVSRIHRRLYDPLAHGRPVSISLQDLCTDVIDAAGRHHVSCRVHAAGIALDLTRTVTVSMVVAEIVTNALKHAFDPENDGSITVRLVRDGETMTLTVADNGRGFDTENQAADRRSLGQRILSSLVAQIDGVINYESAPGRGTTVTVVFPA